MLAIKYVVVETLFDKWKLGFEVVHTYPTTKANDRFTFPRIMRMWESKASRIYRVYPDSTCDIIKEERK